MTGSEYFTVGIIAWLACLAASINLVRIAAGMPGDEDDVELTEDIAQPADPHMESLLTVQAGVDAPARGLDPDLALCRELYPDAPAWPDAHTSAGEDGTS
ncbi:hypothetical protein GCM10011583_11480 [Streptomyces camponoticapitis]|uniref:Uncharacterized protein n=1 Tax=Streptomyces camponoticapitis TaxID=1616125 RepID=A0ABQ2E024_9ACTN|nr:hypothetical protein [Streptomyces camponoticapitis]GGJ81734.1 hypothetical protein GCM10011583_11480 [Streptomyces camponoticapitis]